MLKRYLSLVMLVMLVLPLLTAAKAVDTRKITLEQSNMPPGWNFAAKNATPERTTRSFKTTLNEGIYAFAQQFSTNQAAKAEFNRWKAYYISGDMNFPRPSPRRSVNAYAAAEWRSVDENLCTLYYAVKGNILVSIGICVEYTGVTTATYLDCEALQLDRIAKPGKAGRCPLPQPASEE